MKILDQNKTYSLRLEWMKKRNGGWWLELICRATGQVKIMASHDKNAFDGVTIYHALRWLKNEPWKPMYKKEVI